MKAKKIKKIESFKINQIDKNEIKTIKAGENQQGTERCTTPGCPNWVPLPYPSGGGCGIMSCKTMGQAAHAQ